MGVLCILEGFPVYTRFICRPYIPHMHYVWSPQSHIQFAYVLPAGLLTYRLSPHCFVYWALQDLPKGSSESNSFPHSDDRVLPSRNSFLFQKEVTRVLSSENIYFFPLEEGCKSLSSRTFLCRKIAPPCIQVVYKGYLVIWGERLCYIRVDLENWNVTTERPREVLHGCRSSSGGEPCGDKSFVA